MASSFLKKKAEAQAKKIDEKYGESAYGGSSTLRTGTQATPSAQTSVKRVTARPHTCFDTPPAWRQRRA